MTRLTGPVRLAEWLALLAIGVAILLISLGVVEIRQPIE
jgi:hypothetical protein